ncbi:MAG: hypothetical protein ACK4GB_06925 [Tepidimonas sp.]
MRLILEAVEHLGEDHVVFGPDMSGPRNWTVLRHYGDLGKAVEERIAASLPETVLRKIAFDNSARVLAASLA